MNLTICIPLVQHVHMLSFFLLSLPPSLSPSLPPSLSLSLSSLSLLSLSPQTYEGHFLLRRKSGSCIKQHIKLMPVKDPSGYVSHHVTIRRQLSSQEIRATMYNSGKERKGRVYVRHMYSTCTVHVQYMYRHVV